MTARLAIAGCTLVLAGLAARGSDTHGLALSASHGVARIESSRDGTAVIAAGNLEPGDEVQGSVTIFNRGDAAAPVRLTSARPVDRAGPGGGPLGDVLRVRVAEEGARTAVADGTLGELAGCHRLAALPAHRYRTYRFTARLPRTAGNAYAGSSVRADEAWATGGCDGRTVAASEGRPRLRISHRLVALRDGRARIRLRCLGARRCAGTLTLVPRAGSSRLAAAARAAFSIPGGHSRTISARVPRACLRTLRARRKAIAAAVVRGASISQTRVVTLIARAVG